MEFSSEDALQTNLLTAQNSSLAPSFALSRIAFYNISGNAAASDSQFARRSRVQHSEQMRCLWIPRRSDFLFVCLENIADGVQGQPTEFPPSLCKQSLSLGHLPFANLVAEEVRKEPCMKLVPTLSGECVSKPIA